MPTTLYCDNRNALENAKHPVNTQKLKHINKNAFFVRECVHDGNINAIEIPGTMNPADMFSKLLGSTLHWAYSSFALNLATRSRGRVKE